MKIDRVEAIYLDHIPIAAPPFRDGPSRARTSIVEVENDRGVVGYGISSSPPWPVVPFINTRLADFIIGRDPSLVEALWLQMNASFGKQGWWNGAISAVDIALWDLRGKTLGQPVWKLIGGARPQIQAYVSFGVAGPNTSASQYPVYSKEELVEEARYLVDQGHTRLKTVVGRDPDPEPDRDGRRIAALRDAVGPQVELSIDASKRMTLEDAVRLCKICEPLAITFFEEPVRNNDPKLLSQLHRKTTIPLAANPKGFRAAYRDLILEESVDILQPNVKTMGFTEAVLVAGMAEAFNLRIANGNGAGPHNLHLIAGIPNGWQLEFHYHNWMMYEAVYANVPKPE